MKIMSPFMSPVAAGWTVSVLSTGLLIGGLIALTRALNPGGAYNLGWALIFVYGFPWVWGFVNFILAAGFSLLVAAWWIALEGRPGRRAVLLILTQPIALCCHAVGGLLLSLIVGCVAVGSILDRWPKWRPAAESVVRECWPLAATGVTLLAWQAATQPGPGGDLAWNWNGKVRLLVEVLRDQSQTLDLASIAAAYLVIVVGTLLRARWSWRQGLAPLLIAAMFVTSPSSINGSGAVDTRLWSIALMLALALQDWGSVNRELANVIAWSGALLLAVRLTVLSLGFLQYEKEYKHELTPLQHVRSGSKVFAIHEHVCATSGWRMHRLDTLPALASLFRSAWTNHSWTVPGLHMARSNFDPSRGTAPDLITTSPAACPLHLPLSRVLQEVPISEVDYVWLVGTGLDADFDERLNLVWRSDRSALFEASQPKRPQRSGMTEKGR